MPESPRFWPPPPETPEIRKEQAKLSAAALNAASIACLLTAFVGSLVTAIPDSELTLGVRIVLVLIGAALHLAARPPLRYM
mgnify:CR=1 FL=1